ncbi:hypothetical protein Tco_1181476 [Tanacetum coccineum]
MRNKKAKKKRVAFKDPEKPPKNPIKAQIQRDAEIAQRLFEEEQAQFKREQRITRERAAEQEANDVTLIEQMEDIQARMDADELLAERLQQEEREQFTIEEKSRMLVEMIAKRKRFFVTQIRNKPPTKAQLRNKIKLYEREQKWINDFVPMDSEVVKDSRKGKVEGGRKKTVAWKRTGDDEAINVESLATKYLIVNWKTHILTENMMYYQIIRADGSSKDYKIFSEMLYDFNRQDLLDIYRPVKERFETASLEGYDRLL